jgi:hypothetical protein
VQGLSGFHRKRNGRLFDRHAVAFGSVVAHRIFSPDSCMSRLRKCSDRLCVCLSTAKVSRPHSWHDESDATLTHTSQDARLSAEVVERWNPVAKIRQDLFGADILALKPGAPVLVVQATSGSNQAVRRTKLEAEGLTALWKLTGASLEIWSWTQQGPRGASSALHWLCAQLCDLPLHPRVDVGKGQPKFLGVAPANRGAFDGKRLNFILRKDPTQKLRSNWNGDGTRDTTAPGGEVSQLSDTGHPLVLRGKAATALDGHTRMLTPDYRTSPRHHRSARCYQRTAAARGGALLTRTLARPVFPGRRAERLPSLL